MTRPPAIRSSRRTSIGALDFGLAVELYYWEGLSTSEIAVVLDIAEGTVRSQLARARELLREQITGLGATQQLSRSTLGSLDRWIESVRRRVPDRA